MTENKKTITAIRPTEGELSERINELLDYTGRSDATTLYLRGYIDGLQEWGLLNHLDKDYREFEFPNDSIACQRLKNLLPAVGILESTQMLLGIPLDDAFIEDAVMATEEHKARYPERNRRNLKGTPSLGD